MPATALSFPSVCSGCTAASGIVAFYEAQRHARAGARVDGDCVPRRRAHAAPTVAFALKTAPCGPGTSTIKLDESNRLVTVEEAGLVLLHLHL